MTEQNPARDALSRADDAPAWRKTIEQTVADNFPLDTIGASRLYVWDCTADDCADDDHV